VAFTSHSLVSRQGGGTLVSLIEPADEIVREARELGLQSAVEPALVRLTHGAAPLLRGEPPDELRNFSLKHDVLALVLARWYAEHEGALKAKREEAVKRHWMLAIGVGAFGMLCLFFAFIVYDRGEAALTAKTKAVDLTNRYAIHAPEGSFRRSLLLRLANLDAAAQPSDFYERIMGGNERIRVRTLKTLRELLPRTPWFAGPYQAAGLDPAGGRMALLGRRDDRSDASGRRQPANRPAAVRL
jgi:hypothetical protein